MTNLLLLKGQLKCMYINIYIYMSLFLTCCHGGHQKGRDFSNSVSGNGPIRSYLNLSTHNLICEY